MIAAVVMTQKPADVLRQMLVSVLMGEKLPNIIRIVTQNDPANYADFYTGQINALARRLGVDVVWDHPSRKLTHAEFLAGSLEWGCDFQGLYHLWLLDDDVVYTSRCLKELYTSWEYAHPNAAFIQGSKSDVNNIRGYNDFRFDPVLKEEPLPHYPPTHWNYQYRDDGCIFPCALMDSGNVLIPLEGLESFEMWDKIAALGKREDYTINIPGDTWLSACILSQRPNTYGYLNINAQAHHLEKPNGASAFASPMELRREAFNYEMKIHELPEKVVQTISEAMKGWK